MAKTPETALTIRQERFVEEYLKDRNGTQAAIRAGYSAKNAHTLAANNLRNPLVVSKIDAISRSSQQRVGVNADFVITELKRVAEQEDVAQSTKVRALELLAKHLGMLEDRITLKTDGLSSEQRAERVAILLERVKSR
jgi:phage terminase small subunit